MTKTKFNRIKAELSESGRKSTELALYMGVHVTTVSDWCTNTNQPSIQDLYKISEFLRINVWRLLIPTKWDTEEVNTLSLAADEEHDFFKKAKLPAKKKRASSRKGSGRRNKG